MRVKGDTVQKFALGAALLAALAWNLSHAAEVAGVELATGATGTRAEILLDRASTYTLIRLKAPERLAVDLPASTLGPRLKLPAGNGIVENVRTGQPAPGTVRIVFDLAQPVAVLKPRIEQSAGNARLVLEWPGDEPAPSAKPVMPVAASPAPTAPAVAEVDPARSSADATSRLISELARKPNQDIATTSAARPPAASPAETTAASPTAGTVPWPANTGAAASTATTAAPPAPTKPANAAPTMQAQARPAVADAVAPATAANVDAAQSEKARAPEPAPVVPVAPAMPKSLGGRSLRPLVIAIDPGHGGQDPGAIGLNGNREKDVTLAIARELARQINATPGLKAHLTRDADMFLPLPRRAQLARQARADMFVSIHADAAENRSARGSSVYVLSLKGASSQRARWLADKENASDLIGGAGAAPTGTLASVLLDLTQSGHMKASEDAASQVLAGLKRVGHNHKPNVERANFAVLRTSDMPSMLVETAFISNPDEERRLTDPEHQRKLARAVLDGINGYFTRQPPPGTMYAARAQIPLDGAAGGSP